MRDGRRIYCLDPPLVEEGEQLVSFGVITHHWKGLPMAASAALLAVAAGLAACEGASTTGTATSKRPTIPTSAASIVASQAGEGERRFLEDGVVTFEEYELAFFNMIACVQGKGVNVSDVTLSPRRRYEFQASAPVGQIEDFPGVMNSCRSQYFNEVDRLWSRHTAPTQSEVDEVVREVLACMRAEGADIPETASREDVFNFFTAGGGDVVYGPLGDCVIHTEERLGTGMVIGIGRVEPP